MCCSTVRYGGMKVSRSTGNSCRGLTSPLLKIKTFVAIFYRGPAIWAICRRAREIKDTNCRRVRGRTREREGGEEEEKKRKTENNK